MKQLGGLTGGAAAGLRSPYWASAGAALLCATGLVEMAARSKTAPDSSPFDLLLALPVTLPLALLRVYPVAAAAMIGAATALALLADRRVPLAGLVALVAAYFVAGRLGGRGVAAVLGLPLAAATILAGLSPGVADRLVILVGVIVAATAAIAGATRSADSAAAERRTSDLELADVRAEHAARGERARIARELHDIVAHHISMISAQAEAARLLTASMPPDGAKRLLAIGDTARSALTDMRRLLGVLRQDASAEPTRRPLPGLQELNELLDQTRRLSSASTRLIVAGTVGALPPGVELAAYRIVQEALTNARRHAPGAAVDVELHFRPDGLRIRVWDNGPGYAGDGNGAGHGLTGMHERAAAVGGRLHAGQATTAGFLVEASLPTAGATT